MEDFERKLAKAGWESRELFANRSKGKTPPIKRQIRMNKRIAKTKMKKIVENEQK